MPDSLVDSYDVERHPIAGIVGASGDDAEANAANGDPVATETLVKALATESDRHKVAVGELEIANGYDDSPILDVVGPQPASATATRVGYRVGDAGPIEGHGAAVRLHELLSHTGHTLFLFEGEAGKPAIDEGLHLARRVTERRGPHAKAYVVTTNSASPDPDADELLVDREGAAHARLAPDGPCICLVCPDGHLGLRCTPPSLSVVEAHLARIFL